MQPSDRETLTETMRKLIMTISNNKAQQIRIFDSLSKDDIAKIFQNFENSDTMVRKMSARLIAELMFDNNRIKEKLSETLDIYPINGNVVLNKIPDWLKQTPQKLLEIIKFLKHDSAEQNNKHLCWYIDPQSPVISIQYVNLNTFMLNQFIDPNQCIFGITYTQSPKQSLQNQMTASTRMTTPPLEFGKDIESSPMHTKYYLRTNPDSQKARLNFSSREKALNTSLNENSVNLGQIDHRPAQKLGELSFRNDKNLNKTDKGRISNPVTDRERPITSNLNYSAGSKSRQYELKVKPKQGIEVTSPTSVLSNPIQLRSDRSEERHIIVLGGKTQQSKQLTSSMNYTTSTSTQPKTYMFSKSPILSNYGASSSSSTPNPKTQYIKFVPHLKQPRQQTQTKIRSDYKPSDEFMRKIKDSIKARN